MKAPEGWPESGIIEFKDYATSYRDGLETVLKGISCVIRHGERVCITQYLRTFNKFSHLLMIYNVECFERNSYKLSVSPIS